MKSAVLVLFLLIWASVSAGHAVEIEGVNLPDTLKADGETLLLNGAGVRTKAFLKLYVGGLYLREKCGNPESIISADEPMAIRLHILSKMITSEKMSASLRDGFAAATGGNTRPLTDRIETLISVFKEGINRGDIYDLIYTPGKGVESFKNGNLVTTVAGLDFKKALFGIWLCAKPTVNVSLQHGMLGR